MGSSVDRVLVVGAGTMGTQIAAVFARAGIESVLADINLGALDRSAAEAATRLHRLAEKGAIESAPSVLSRLRWTTDLAQAARGCDFVVEAASERLDIKQSLFKTLDGAAPDHAILTTNSSTIPSSMLAESTRRPDRVCNMHFFNPPLVMDCVEVIPNPRTSSETLNSIVALTLRIGKSPVQLSKEVPGFIANRLMNAIQEEAIRLYADGVATLADIDRAATLALGHPMGPFQLMDLVGLDVIDQMHEAEVELTGDLDRRTHPALKALVDSGRIGRKSGHGWYEYETRKN